MLLILTTIRRLALPVFVFLAWTPAAYAWSWPVQGSVLQPFVYDEAHPYASGQHRGIDIGADGAAGETVVAPAAGTVSFAGTVPTSGQAITIETPGGYSVTLTHLGTILVSEDEAVAEGDTVGTIGPSGISEVDAPYVHLGIRVTADPNGYVDPLSLLPPVIAESPPADSDPPALQPSSSGGSSTTTPVTTPAAEPAPTVPASAPAASPQAPTVRTTRTRVFHRERARPLSSRPEAERPRSSQRPAAAADGADAGASTHAATPRRRPSTSTLSSQRPVVEAVASVRRTRFGAGLEPRLSLPAAERPSTSQRQTPSVLLPLVCNGTAALVALAAAFVAAICRLRRRVGAFPLVGAQVLRLPRPVVEGRHEQRAA